MKNMHKMVVCGKFIGECAGAIGGIVIHHQQIHRQRIECLHNAREIIAFIVRRHNDEG